MPTAALFALLAAVPTVGELGTAIDPQAIVGGQPVSACGFPTVVAIDDVSCTGTLVHPRVISTAQHCGDPRRVLFGAGGSAGFEWQADVLGCVREGSDDAMLCLLDTEIPLATTPIAYGCELDELVAVGQPVAIAGFGSPEFGVPGQVKEWALQRITAVENDRVIVGEPGQSPSPCSGDSGGPVFVQAADGSWRTAGTVFRGTTGIPCNSAADFQRVDRVVPFFEAATGLDITPCFDGQTGAWDPGPSCTGFSAAGPNTPASWDNWCAAAPVSGPSNTCGAPFAEADDAVGASCDGFCGGQSDVGCWCDAQCVAAGDCCSDRDDVCDIPADGAFGGDRQPTGADLDEVGPAVSGGCSVSSGPPAGLFALFSLLLPLLGRRRNGDPT